MEHQHISQTTWHAVHEQYTDLRLLNSYHLQKCLASLVMEYPHEAWIGVFPHSTAALPRFDNLVNNLNQVSCKQWRHQKMCCVVHGHSGTRTEEHKYMGFLMLRRYIHHVNIAVFSQWVAALYMKWIFKFVLCLRRSRPSLIQYFEPAINFSHWSWLGMIGAKLIGSNFNFNTVNRTWVLVRNQ